MKKLCSIVLLLAMLLTLVACGAGASTDAAKEETPAETTGEGSKTEADSGGKEFINIATGTMSGTYYSLGISLASLFNEKSERNISFSAEATNGSGQNIEFLASGECAIALVNNDVAKAAIDGTGTYEGNAIENLRGMTSIYANSIHVIVPMKSDVQSVADLAGKTVSVGAAGSGVESITHMIVEAYGMNYWDAKDFTAEYLDVSASMDKLKNGQLDAVFMTGLPPMSAVVDAFMSGDMRLVALEDDVISTLTENHPELFETTIAAGTYTGQDEDIKTVANGALLLTSADVDEEVVYELTKLMYENSDYLVERNNVWAQMTAESYDKGMTVPFHPGAERYFKEAGIIK